MPAKRNQAKGTRSQNTLLSHGRPPNFTRKSESLSSKASRTLIRKHHELRKQQAKALAQDNFAEAEAIAGEIEAQGGLKIYQQASLNGQSKERGGDSSKTLLQWLEPSWKSLQKEVRPKLRMLEIGALTSSNACSRQGMFDVTRIDLNAQDEGIQQQDFMERPLPVTAAEKFDIISLSLVLNFVPNPLARGDMLLRTTSFLGASQVPSELKEYFPSLFLVLPAPCVLNSRYMNEAKLQELMHSLGYFLVKHRLSKKLGYYLWRHDAAKLKENHTIAKTEVNPGRGRNNFSIVRA